MTTPSRSFFDAASPNPQRSILPQQTSPTRPQSDHFSSATSLIVPDLRPQDRYTNFDPEQYDLADESHLVRFLNALVGDPGAGGLRKTYTVTSFEATITSTHFFDLDRFYGAILGLGRNPNEQPPLDPMSDVATPQEWDTVQAADATYRERIYALAKAINMGGTKPGLRAAAEAITGVPCDIYEVWSIYDPVYLNRGGLPEHPEAVDSWDEVEQRFLDWNSFLTVNNTGISDGPETVPTSGPTDRYGAVDAPAITWDDVANLQYIGQGGATNREGDYIINRFEIIVRPKKNYFADPDDPTHFERVAKATEEADLIRVLNVLKPAGSFISVDDNGLDLHVPAEIRDVVADSEGWEVVQAVTPAQGVAALADSVYPPTPYQADVGVGSTDLHALGRPPFTAHQGEIVSYAGDVVSITSYAELADGTPETGDDYETVAFTDGTLIAYTPDKGVLDARSALAGNYARKVRSHPYAGDRRPVVRHG